MSSTEITLTCGAPRCGETFATGRSLWKYAEIEGRDAGWEIGEKSEYCPEHAADESGAFDFPPDNA